MGFVAAIPTAVYAIAGAAASVAGTVVSAMGAEQSAKAQQQSAAYQAQVAANNAIIANQNAEAATKAGATQATTQSLQNRARLGAVVAGEAANNVDVTSGSAVDVQQTQRELGQLDVETTVSNADLTAYGYRSQATGYTASAGLETATAANAATAGNIAATGDILSGASSLGLKWAQLQAAGAVGGGATSTGTTLAAANNPEFGGAAPAGGLT